MCQANVFESFLFTIVRAKPEVLLFMTLYTIDQLATNMKTSVHSLAMINDRKSPHSYCYRYVVNELSTGQLNLFLKIEIEDSICICIHQPPTQQLVSSRFQIDFER
jgi:hypothetical protein